MSIKTHLIGLAAILIIGIAGSVARTRLRRKLLRTEIEKLRSIINKAGWEYRNGTLANTELWMRVYQYELDRVHGEFKDLL